MTTTNSDSQQEDEQDACNNPYGMPNALWTIRQQMRHDALLNEQKETARAQRRLAELQIVALASPSPIPAPASQPATPLLNPATIRTLYLKLLKHPALVEELTAYQKSELRAYAEGEQLAATRLAVELMDANPQYPYPPDYPNGREVDYWQAKNSGYVDSERVLRLLAPAAPVAATPTPAAQPRQPAAPAGYPWVKIEALTEQVGLRKNGAFLLAPKWIAAAMAGVIDALCEAEILPASGELERLYTEFTRHYGRSIKADRVTPTRATWQKKARKELGLE